MAPLNRQFRLLLSVIGTLALAAGALNAQWPGLETFQTANALPSGWELSPGGTGTPNLWNVDANGNYRPGYPQAPNANFTPYHSAPYSLNWNDGVRAYPHQSPTSTPLERGVLTPPVDVTFAPNPELKFWTLWDRSDPSPENHVMLVRVWNTNYTTMLASFQMPAGTGGATGLTPWHERIIPLNRQWGNIRIEFFYRCGPAKNHERAVAGWFIDNVEVTGLTPPTFGIATASNLGAFDTTSQINIQLQTQYGTPPIHSWSVTAGNMPTGLNLDVNGVISGSPSEAGVFNFTIQARDSSAPNLVANKQFSMTVTRGSNFVFPIKDLPYIESFNTDTGWVYSTGNVPYGPSPGQYSDLSAGGWERGPTAASVPASSFDNGDPPNDGSGTPGGMLLGVVVGGPIPQTIAINEWYWAYSPQIRIGGQQQVQVSFKRWLNCYSVQTHNVAVQMWDPTVNNWMPIWSMASGDELNTTWRSYTGAHSFGGTPVANATTRLRFGYRVMSQTAFTTQRGGGANFDDIQITKVPLPNILRIIEFDVLSLSLVGAHPRLYVGSSYPVLLLLENTAGANIEVYAHDLVQEAPGYPTWTSQNVGHFVFSQPPTVQPWVIPPGQHYVSYDPAHPPPGAPPMIAPFEFMATALGVGPAGPQAGLSVYLRLSLTGDEVGGLNRAVVADSRTDPSGDELIHVDPVPQFEIVDPSPLPDGIVGQFYSYRLSAQHGTLPYHSWRITAGPTWMTMVDDYLEFTPDPADVPNPPQSFQVTIEVEDSASTPAIANKQFTVTIQSPAVGLPPLQFTTSTQLPNARERLLYSPVAFNATGGTAPYSYGSFAWLSVAEGGNGPLSGVNFDPVSGTLSGTPDAGTFGTYSFRLTVTDSTPPTPLSTVGIFYISVLPETDSVTILTPQPVGSSGSPPFGLETEPYNNNTPFKFEATGGFVGPPGQEYQWTIAFGQLPPGLVLDGNSGELYGIPTVAGLYDFTLRASDGAFPPASGYASYRILIDPLVPTPLQIATLSNLPQGHEGNLYQKVLEARYGMTPYTWAVKAGSQLPDGLVLNWQTGEIRGVITPSQVPPPNGNMTFTVEVTDSAMIPVTAEKTFTMNIVAFIPGALIITTDKVLPQGGVQSPYSTFLRATGGAPADPMDPYQFSLEVDSRLPAGLTLSASGRLEGIPTASGLFTFTVECVDGTSGFASKTFELQINGGAGQFDEAVELIPGDRRTEWVPFWEACSVGARGGSVAIIALAALAAFVLRRRKRAA